MDEVLSVAEQIYSRLGAPEGGEYACWLSDTVGRLEVRCPDVLEALRDLGVPIITTNYDSLIEDVTGLQPVTWRETWRVEQVLRGDASGVLHIHGHWDDPASVVLGIRSYQEILKDNHSQAVLRGLRTMQSLMFVGFGAGLADPNFDAFLRWSQETFSGSFYRHFRLARTSEVDTLKLQHPPAERLYVTAYGENHDALAPFLRSLGGTQVASRVSPDLNHGLTHSTGYDGLWNVPHARNPNFSGRKQLLIDLRHALEDKSSIATNQGLAVQGIGGVGKTQLVVEYAYRHVDDYDAVWWLRAGTTETLAADFAALGQELGLVPAEAQDDEASRATRRWLESRAAKWLLVFDSSSDPRTLESYLPRAGTGHVIVTSTRPVWRELVVPFPVTGFSREEAMEFLLRRSGKDKLTDEEELAAAGTLAEEFDGLPLALAQAAAFIEETGESFVGYRQLYQERRAALLAEGGPPVGYPETVMTTWQLAFEEVAKTRGAVELLFLGAFLAPETIPLDLLAAHASVLPEPLASVLTDPLDLRRAIGALRSYSLIEFQNAREISMHRLVQVVARNKLSDEQREFWTGAALLSIESAFPSRGQDSNEWQTCERLLVHGLSVSRHANDETVAQGESDSLKLKMRRYVNALGKGADIRQSMSVVSSAYRTIYGSDYDYTVDPLMLGSQPMLNSGKGGSK
jgi:hypothetical protein